MALVDKQVAGLRQFKNGIRSIGTVTGTVTGALTLDLNEGAVGVFNVDLSSGSNITEINVTNGSFASGVDTSFVVFLRKAAGDSFTFAPAAGLTFLYEGGNAPTLNANGNYDRFVFQCINGAGTVFFVSGAGSDFS